MLEITTIVIVAVILNIIVEVFDIDADDKIEFIYQFIIFITMLINGFVILALIVGVGVGIYNLLLLLI